MRDRLRGAPTAQPSGARPGQTTVPRGHSSNDPTLEEPLKWANATLVRRDAVEAVRAMKEEGSGLMSTLGSVSLCRSLLRAGLVDRFRVGMFPVITGVTGAERIYDGYPDVALDMIESRTFDGRIQLVEYRPRVLDHPPLASTA
jgi:dihydrofolate reductase